jgi:hypothetical protein
MKDFSQDSCNSTIPDRTSKKPYTTHSLKDNEGVTENIKNKSTALYNTNDTEMQHQ